MRTRHLWFVTALLAACEHSAPFRPGSYSPDGPFGAGPPTLLTLNPLNDRTPAWLPDGMGILYSAERLDRADHDHCLAELPPAGGAIRRWVCRTTASDDTINVFEYPAVGAADQLVYVRVSAFLGFGPPLAPDAQDLVLATLGAPRAVTRVLLTIPSPSPSGRVYEAISHIGWLGPSRLVYLEETVRYLRPCRSCVPDTVRTGIELVTLDIAAPTRVLAAVAGTDSASSVAVGATGDTIYFTKNGDSRVYRYAFSSDTRDTVHDFGAAGIARDVAFANGRLLAVVGGDVSYVVDSVVGPAQRDHGGELHFVTLLTGAEAVIGNSASRYRHPAFSPDGARVVAESWTSGRADLWLLDAP